MNLMNNQDYIDIRSEQLREERDKNNDEYDIMWFNKMIAELQWVKLMQTKRGTNCTLPPKNLL